MAEQTKLTAEQEFQMSRINNLLRETRSCTSKLEKNLKYILAGGVLAFVGAVAYASNYTISGASAMMVGGGTMLLSAFLDYAYDSRLKNLQKKLINSFDNSREREERGAL